MKRIICILMVVAILVCPSTSIASYLITMKNGRVFQTNYYWEEGKEIVFNYHGGIIRIERYLVHEIKDSDLDDVLEESIPEETEKISEKPVEVERKTELKQENEIRLPSDPGKDVVLKRKSDLETEIQTVSAAYKVAKAENNPEQMNELWKKMLSLNNKLIALRDEAKATHNGQIPSWWDGETEEEPVEEEGCESDDDCEGDLVCVDGFCV